MRDGWAVLLYWYGTGIYLLVVQLYRYQLYVQYGTGGTSA
jgi:hypothetical protein